MRSITLLAATTLLAGPARAQLETWHETLEQYVEQRTEHAATLLRDGSLLLTGGRGPDATVLSSAELFDTVTSSFGPAAPMSMARAEPAADCKTPATMARGVTTALIF